MEYRTLNNGVKMPMLGYGVYQIPQEDTENCVSMALKAGYRLIDTAQVYGNEEGVGNAIAKSGIPRNEIFITTKIWVSNYGYEKAKESIEESLRKLKTDYIDLLFLHEEFGDYYGAWRAVEEAYKAGKVKAVGISNFDPTRAEDLMNHNEIKPMIAQIEINPLYQHKEAVDFYKSKNIAVESWASFGEGMKNMFTNPTIEKVGAKYGKSNAQVILRWLIQKDITVIPKSVHEERIKQNIDVFDFKLSDDDIKVLDNMDEGKSLFFEHESPETADMIFGITPEHNDKKWN